MPSAVIPDLSLPSLLSPGLTQNVEQLALLNVDTGTAPNVTDGTYVLQNAAGATVATVAGITGTGGADAVLTLAADVPVGRYRETWTLTLDSGTIPPVTREAWVTPVPLLPLVNTTVILRAHPQLTTYPSGASTWINAVYMGWVETIRRAMSHGKGWLMWDSSALFLPHLYSTLKWVFRSEGTYGESSWLALAREYETREQDAWDDLRMALDTDGDGDLDDQAYHPQDAGGFPDSSPVRG